MPDSLGRLGTRPSCTERSFVVLSRSFESRPPTAAHRYEHADGEKFNLLPCHGSTSTRLAARWTRAQADGPNAHIRNITNAEVIFAQNGWAGRPFTVRRLHLHDVATWRPMR